jgi:cytochrome P450
VLGFEEESSRLTPMILAAADTMVSSLSTFFLAMICYPQVQVKLQRELDAALSGSLPNYASIENLPYLTAVIMEVLR